MDENTIGNNKESNCKAFKSIEHRGEGGTQALNIDIITSINKENVSGNQQEQHAQQFSQLIPPRTFKPAKQWIALHSK